MQSSVSQRSMTGPAVVGMLLILVGAVVLATRAVGYNIFTAVGEWGWPFFIIVPGIMLLGASLIVERPKGVGFATAGAIVTTVGSLLLYQSRTGHWESWAYAWTLLPMAAGAASILYGLFSRVPGMVRSGLWMVGITAVLFVAGAWYFEGIFAGRPEPFDLAAWWPVGVIVLGAVIVLRAMLFPAKAQVTPPAAEPANEPPTAV